MRPNSEIYTGSPNGDNKHLHPFHMQFPLPPGRNGFLYGFNSNFRTSIHDLFILTPLSGRGLGGASLYCPCRLFEHDGSLFFSYVFWLGDFNYRINETIDNIKGLCGKKEYSALWKHDQVEYTPLSQPLHGSSRNPCCDSRVKCYMTTTVTQRFCTNRNPSPPQMNQLMSQSCN